MVVKVVMVIIAVIVVVVASVNVTAPRQGRRLAITAAPGSGSITVILLQWILPSTHCQLIVRVAIAVVVHLAIAGDNDK